MLEKCGVPLYKKQMVEHILDHIISSNTDFNIEVSICRSSNLSTFVKQSTYLYIAVARFYPSANSSSGRFRNRSIYAAGRGDRGVRRGGCFNVRGRGRGHGGRCGQIRGGHV